MGQLPPKMLILIGLIALAVIGVFFALVAPYFSSERVAQKRRAHLVHAGAKRIATTRTVDATQRRKQIAESLKELENREKKARRVTIDQKLLQAGLGISRVQFYAGSCVLGATLGIVLLLATQELFMLAAGLFVGGLGLPHWVLAFLRKRRLAKFSTQFPDAIDVIIRGVKAGLPLLDSLRVVSSEFAEPIRSEFRIVIETQSVGLSVTDAVERIVERVPVSEARFFAILIGIQQKSGGNLAEGLGNLSRVLRERKRLAHKIKAMSAEAKASAGIIGSLPFVVATLVYITSPGYMDMLWTTDEGRIMLVGSAIWMSLGVFIMKRMISFEV